MAQKANELASMNRYYALAHVTFRLTQVFTGHGCFGVYLHRIGREPTMQCHHCEDQDSAQHMLTECRAW